ncbi:MAG: hypothetical protein COT74_00350 [Bdellovibrionales bacterium CG10_big_fil_rev_8_21_14_0_10_45_34]|nr:MAG: hypothetical protein COT74_00350 [Bdellovibrionales bacterium CG10_big_fil_rev_8_21_14_0_10_45_34]
MDNQTKAAVVSCLLFLNACATTTQSALLGAAVGGVAGGAIGQAQTQDSQGTLTGAAIGVGVGALMGFLSGKGKKKEDLKTEAKTLSDEDTYPALTKPKLRSVWVPDKVEGNKYIKGHWIYVIEDAGSWSKD